MFEMGGVWDFGHGSPLTADRWSHRHGFERSEPDGQSREDRANPQSVSLEETFGLGRTPLRQKRPELIHTADVETMQRQREKGSIIHESMRVRRP